MSSGPGWSRFFRLSARVGRGAALDSAWSGGERHLVADPDRGSVAGSPGGVRVVADRLRPPPDLVEGDGTWDRVLRGLQRGSDGDDPEWVVSIDSTSVRAHHHAAGARKAAPVDVSAERLVVAFVDDQQEVVMAVGDIIEGRIELQESARWAGGSTVPGGAGQVSRRVDHQDPSRRGPTLPADRCPHQ